ncbi:MAG: hypothetical protein AAF722_00265 [Cyanobacteria bacterium P01_C01_bin.70]
MNRSLRQYPQTVKLLVVIDCESPNPRSLAKPVTTRSAPDPDLEALWLLELLMRPA